MMPVQDALAEVERLRASLTVQSAERFNNQTDADRYRWLRAKAFWQDERDMAPGGRWYMIVVVNKGKPSVDEAIDAMLAPSAGSGQ
jgi:hypothetical protein